MLIGVERSEVVAVRSRRTEAEGICSGSLVELSRDCSLPLSFRSLRICVGGASTDADWSSQPDPGNCESRKKMCLVCHPWSKREWARRDFRFAQSLESARLFLDRQPGNDGLRKFEKLSLCLTDVAIVGHNDEHCVFRRDQHEQ